MAQKSKTSKLRLILLRHAKSAWPQGVADRDRPLAERGRAAAPLIGDYIAREKLVPDLALVSPARRAQETWALVREQVPAKVREREAPEIYEVGAGQIVDAIRAVEPDVRTLLLVGHNPGMENAASLLTGDGEEEAMQRIKEKFPTAGLAVIDFDIERWDEVVAGSGFLQRFVTPRSLK